MGFLVSILYFVTYYLAPSTIFGQLAQYRVELILAVLVFLFSLPKLIGSPVLKSQQSIAIAGLTFAVFMSILFAMRWAGGGVQAFFGFIANSCLAFFLVFLYCDSKKKLQVIVSMLFFVCFFVIVRGSFDLSHVVMENGPIQLDQSDDERADAIDQWNIDHPYLYVTYQNEQPLYRLRGLGLISDPNDFGQLAVCVLPLMFFFWRPNSPLNVAFVILPVCILLYGVYLTHSRGALVALAAVGIVSMQRRIGTLPALALVGSLFFLALALHFTGGRDISAAAGEDRTGLWGEGMQALESHPVFGVGFGNLSDYTEDHLTAHNTIIVCAAELGIFGFYFWCLYLFPTLRDVLIIASPLKVREGQLTVPEGPQFPHPVREDEQIDRSEINRLGRLLVLSFTGFLIAGMFLSRAFAMTLFLLGGMTEAVYEMALRRGMLDPHSQLLRTFKNSAILMVALLFVMYIIIRFLNLMR